MALSPAQTEKLSKLSKEQLLAYIDMLQKNWWRMYPQCCRRKSQ